MFISTLTPEPPKEGDEQIFSSLPQPTPPLPIITQLAFKRRFPAAKWLAARAAAKEAGPGSQIAGFFEDFDLSIHGIQLNDEGHVRTPVTFMADTSWPEEFRLTAEEVAAVLDAPVTDNERP
jgi:hypothetical protein